ncbi:MAG: VIT1/CCC1 transporter family protein [Patescibacteria group bacterium]|uniref:VIT1/CCC1 transporter family protein n=1 Tax=candidate division WWE3 bacterium TaxID=2053526 RepID=A0A955EB44_UNCKA|nr:VIT1/CCC1 transporter family protein [candidate division WWE3 bacterium]
MNLTKINSNYIRNLIFGAEDSLVSSVGVLFGIASAGVTSTQIWLTGLIVISVEALSMGAGAYLSEITTYEVNGKKNKKDNPVIDGIIMFTSYFFAGFIPLIPYKLVNPQQAKFLSVVVTLVALYVLGYAPQKQHKSAIRMLVIAGLAIAVGFVVALIFNI